MFGCVVVGCTCLRLGNMKHIDNDEGCVVVVGMIELFVPCVCICCFVVDRMFPILIWHNLVVFVWLFVPSLPIVVSCYGW